jgi:hypothetical protein
VPATAGIDRLSGLLDQDCRMRPIAVTHVAEQRQHDRQQNALLDTDHHHHCGSDQRQRELTRTLAPDVAQTSHVDELDSNRENNG